MIRSRTTMACALLLLPLIAAGCGNATNDNGVRTKQTGHGTTITQMSSNDTGGTDYLRSGYNRSGRMTTNSYGTSTIGTTGFGVGSRGPAGYGTPGYGTIGYGTSGTAGNNTIGYGNTGLGTTGNGMTGMTSYSTGMNGLRTTSSDGSMSGRDNSDASRGTSGYRPSSSVGMSAYGTGANGSAVLESQLRTQGYKDILMLGDMVIVGKRGTSQGRSTMQSAGARNVLTVTDDKAIQAIRSVNRKLASSSNISSKAASISSDIRLILIKAKPAR